MNCKKCNAPLSDDMLFCSECGKRVDDVNISMPELTKREVSVLPKIDSVISIFGEEKVNLYLSLICILMLLFIRIFGFLITSLIFTAVNGYLVYLNYKKTSKLNLKMFFLSITVLVVGIITFFWYRLLY